MLLRKYLYLFVGCLSFIVGFAALFIPILPTTPFILLAAFCFSKSSERFHHWLLKHHLFGPVIKDWQDNGAIAIKAKIVALTMLTVSAIFISQKTNIGSEVKLVALTVLASIATFILTRPSK